MTRAAHLLSLLGISMMSSYLHGAIIDPDQCKVQLNAPFNQNDRYRTLIVDHPTERWNVVSHFVEGRMSEKVAGTKRHLIFVISSLKLDQDLMNLGFRFQTDSPRTAFIRLNEQSLDSVIRDWTRKQIPEPQLVIVGSEQSFRSVADICETQINRKTKLTLVVMSEMGKGLLQTTQRLEQCANHFEHQATLRINQKKTKSEPSWWINEPWVAFAQKDDKRAPFDSGSQFANLIRSSHLSEALENSEITTLYALAKNQIFVQALQQSFLRVVSQLEPNVYYQKVLGIDKLQLAQLHAWDLVRIPHEVQVSLYGHELLQSEFSRFETNLQFLPALDATVAKLRNLAHTHSPQEVEQYLNNHRPYLKNFKYLLTYYRVGMKQINWRAFFTERQLNTLDQLRVVQLKK